MQWINSVLVATLVAWLSVDAEILNRGEVYADQSGTQAILDGTGFGDAVRVYLLPDITLDTSVLIGFEVYFERSDEVTLQVWREHSTRLGYYWLVYSYTVTPVAGTTQNIDFPGEQSWKVRSTDRIGFQSTTVVPPLLTRSIPGFGNFLYSAIGSDYLTGPDVTVRKFSTGLWPWKWSLKVKLDTEINDPKYSGISSSLQPLGPTTTTTSTTTTSSPTTPVPTTPATDKPGTTIDSGSSSGGTTNGNGQTAAQTGELSVLLNYWVILAILIWCLLITIFVLVLCCCLIARSKNEKKRKFYIDYLRRQNPYIESLRSKDYSWNDFSNADSNPDEHKSDIGFVNNMVTNEEVTSEPREFDESMDQ